MESLKNEMSRLTASPKLKHMAVRAFHAQLVLKDKEQEARAMLDKMHARMVELEKERQK